MDSGTHRNQGKNPSREGELCGEPLVTAATAKPWLKSIFDHMDEAVFLAPISPEGVHGNFVEVNEAVCRRYGYSREELLTLNARTLNPTANLDRVRSFGRRIQREGRTLFTAIHVSKDGAQIPVEVSAKRIEIDGQPYVLSVVRDLREQQLLQKAEARFGHLMDHSWHEIYIFESNTLQFLQVNQGALDNLGYNNQEIHYLKFTDLSPSLRNEDFAKLTKPLFDGTQGLLVFETTLMRKGGSTYPVEVRLQLSHSEVPPIFLANVQDITERKKTESRLQFLANFDALTELPNRSLYLDRLKVTIENCIRYSRLAAVIFLDLDGFKAINDTLGHSAGDQLIREVGRRLRRCVRKSDTVARLGGDEFTVLLSNVSGVSNVEYVAQKIIQVVAEPMEISGQDVNITTSLGITLCPLDDNDTAETLIRQADSAMYRAKASGKNTFEFYHASLAAGELRHLELMNELKLALSRNEFELYYQPRVNLGTQKVIGAEALLRWKHPQLGFVSPVEFIPLLEANGHIKEVGAWVLSEACRQLQKWYKQGHELRLSINVSARQFEKGIFSTQLQQHIQQLGIPPALLEIEITEGFLISQTEQAAETLNRLKAIGVKISLDDFGTGYSSLAYLKQLPIDILKIDRSFVMDMQHSSGSTAIVDAIIGLAQSLGLRVTAEGIEKESQAHYLKRRHCDEGQGYLFGKPMPEAEFERVCLQEVVVRS